MNLLIIEDDPMVAYIHQKYLEKLIHQPTIFTVATIAEGLQLTKEKQPVLVLLDVHLKDGNGLTYLATIRDEKIDTEVILITAANELENVKRSLHLGVLDYLVKPFLLSDFNKVSKTIRKKLLNSRWKRRSFRKQKWTNCFILHRQTHVKMNKLFKTCP